MYHLELRQEGGGLDFFLYGKVVELVTVSKYIGYESVRFALKPNSLEEEVIKS